ncbi:hypothetical protein BpHYR1_054189 [Brachionus plicatilis]|uniref:Uncharacterized protein n=1 Tax=Brachionus plicatilis TaxID=10195 RepID=A0A3M7Q6F8_BRAPC|nr:hypothetical protein BpHYR1_054189 [Brachionus plicatilis]
MPIVDPNYSPSINSNSTLLQLEVPPVGILLITSSGYLVVFFIIYMIIYFAKTKGACPNDLCSCGPDAGCCQCLESCSDACSCGTPTVDKCLDVCCPKRNLDFVGLILCQCCSTPENPCCTACGDQTPCCSYGDLNCNCACIQPDQSSFNCLCCQIGNANYDRADDDED